MADGNVYVFNATPNTVSLFLNSHMLKASVPGVQLSTQYTPTPTSVARNPADKPGVAQFGSDNTLIVSFDAGGAQEYSIPIDPNQIPITADLQLYIFFNEVVLVTPTGAGQQVVFKGKAVNKADIEAVTVGA
jgi:hypothetical protein